MIVLHAGMPKAGSSSIQGWLGRLAPTLRQQGGFTVVTSRPPRDADTPMAFTPYKGGGVSDPAWIIKRYSGRNVDRPALAEEFARAVADSVRTHGRIVFSAEAFAQPFWKADEPMLGALDRLARECPVRVAYYVRPQHTALEAAWRQWGFRSPMRPTEYVLERSKQLHYRSTLLAVRRLAPHVSFEVRPFRRDLLDDGDVVTDFGRRFLGFEPGTVEAGLWENRGLPLEVVNLLASAPTGLFWRNMHDNTKLERIKEIIGEIDLPTTDLIVRSRRILHAHCHTVFEADNVRLIEQLGWPAEHFIPPVEMDQVEDLDALDRLWAPQASTAERALLYELISRSIS